MISFASGAVVTGDVPEIVIAGGVPILTFSFIKLEIVKMSFPEFMFSAKNMIPPSQQNTPDIEGYLDEYLASRGK